MTLRRPADEVARLGDEIYDREIRPLVEADHLGDYLAIDIESGCWSIGETLTEARDRLDLQRPAAHDVFLMRVGHPVLHHFGGRPLRSAQ